MSLPDLIHHLRLSNANALHQSPNIENNTSIEQQCMRAQWPHAIEELARYVPRHALVRNDIYYR
jgi:DNA-binding NtrC family response regulator